MLIITTDIDQFCINEFNIAWPSESENTIMYTKKHRIRYLPKEFYNTTTIKYLGLSCLNEIRDTILNLRKIKKLYIKMMEINSIILEMEHIIYFQFNWNIIELQDSNRNMLVYSLYDHNNQYYYNKKKDMIKTVDIDEYFLEILFNKI